MKWTASFAALLLLGGGMASPVGARVDVPAAHRAQAAPAAFPALKAFADAAVRDGKVPGMVIAIGVGNGPTRFVTAGRTGFAATDPAVSADTLWRIYSMTKPITGMAAMILVDRGKLHLDDPVSKFFPEFHNARVLIDPAKGTETRPAKGEITIRELMTHTSGLNYAIVIDTPAKKALEQAGITPFQANPAVEAKARPTRPASLADFARKVGTTPLVADPATTLSYSMGLDVLAAIVEKVSDTPFDRFVQKEILTPLRMTSTYWRVPGAKAGQLASSYAPKALADLMWRGLTTPATDKLELVDTGRTSVYLQAPSFPYGGAGLVSTARDYDRFLHMLRNDGTLDGKRILSPATARLAMSNLLPSNLALSGFGPIPAGEKFGFGAGGFVVLDKKDGLSRGRGTFGWDGAAGTRAWTDPVRRLRVTMMINVFGSGTLGDELDTAITQDIVAATPR